jgi:hypothetical protein
MPSPMSPRAALQGAQSTIVKHQFTAILWFALIVVTLIFYHVLSDGDFSFLLTLGSVVRLFAFLVVVLKLLTTGSAEGLSGKTLYLYAVAFASRLTSILRFEGYLPYDKSGDWLYQTVELLTLVFVLVCIYLFHSKVSCCETGWARVAGAARGQTGHVAIKLPLPGTIVVATCAGVAAVAVRAREACNAKLSFFLLPLLLLTSGHRCSETPGQLRHRHHAWAHLDHHPDHPMRPARVSVPPELERPLYRRLLVDARVLLGDFRPLAAGPCEAGYAFWSVSVEASRRRDGSKAAAAARRRAHGCRTMDGGSRGFETCLHCMDQAHATATLSHAVSCT